MYGRKINDPYLHRDHCKHDDRLFWNQPFQKRFVGAAPSGDMGGKSRLLRVVFALSHRRMCLLPTE
jgi:hypothetical protein